MAQDLSDIIVSYKDKGTKPFSEYCPKPKYEDEWASFFDVTTKLPEYVQLDYGRQMYDFLEGRSQTRQQDLYLLSLRNQVHPQSLPPVFGTFLPQVPSNSAIEEAVEESREMLSWPDNWDEEGGVAIQEETWIRATTFLITTASDFLRLTRTELPKPLISAGPDGSIDIHWRDRPRELLINVPADPTEPMSFYGDNHRVDVVKGTMEYSSPNKWILIWLVS